MTDEASDSQLIQASIAMETSTAGGTTINNPVNNNPFAAPPLNPGYGPALLPPSAPLVDATPYGLQNAPGLPLPNTTPARQYKNGLGEGNDPWHPQQQQPLQPPPPCPAPGLHQPQDPTDLRTEVLSLFASLQTTMEESQKETQAALTKAINVQLQVETDKTISKIGMLVDKLVSEINTKIAEHDKEIQSLKATCLASQSHIESLQQKQAAQESAMLVMSKKLEALELKAKIGETKMGGLERNMAKDFDFTLEDVTWDRDPDPTILRINTQSHVLKADLQAELEDNWNRDLEPTDWVLLGTETGASQRWVLRFRGPCPRSAARKAAKAFGLQKDAEGAWEDIHCKTPTGQLAKVYISKDKSPKAQKLEMHTKRLHKTLCSLLPDIPSWKIYKDLAGGIVSIGWQRVVKVDLVSKSLPPTLLFNEKCCTELGIAKETVKKAFEGFKARPSDEEMWVP